MVKNEDKSLKERRILNLIYKESDYQVVEESEDPDFKIKYKYEDRKFGVEITEFYLNGSNARIRNIPIYFEEIMNNRRYRHKEDKKVLEVKELELISSDGSVEPIEGIMQELPSYEEYSDLLADMINNKSNKYINYDKQLSHINLIIYDTERRLNYIIKEEFCLYVMKNKLIKELIRTEFREIFLITAIDSKEYYFPLKLIFVLTELYKLNAYINSNPQLVKSEEHELLVFASYLHSIGMKNIAYIDKESIEIISSGYGIIVDENNKLTIRNYNDYSIPKNSVIFNPEIESSSKFSSEVLNHINEFSSDSYLGTNIGFEVLND
ncbi:hypothetical protein CIW83_03035 [Tissierella sp. P1]|uniref:hypothetical protein n=1 Tax=Tissierella sp. P1 TaxID=1280483 RepID=UPI000BA09AC0|nr:hypothetical protein [Tissierella sp. P1]OZV13535.1 hypothetical protein CIW83_03035 [Tissierella sp. P1]